MKIAGEQEPGVGKEKERSCHWNTEREASYSPPTRHPAAFPPKPSSPQPPNPLWDQASEKGPREELPSSKFWKRNHSDPSVQGELLLSCSSTKVTLQTRAPPALRPLFDKIFLLRVSKLFWETEPLTSKPAPTQHAGLLEHMNNVQVGACQGRQISAINQLSGLVYLLPRPTSGSAGDEASFFLQPKTKPSKPVIDTARCARRL